MMRYCLLLLSGLAFLHQSTAASDVDLDIVTKIRDEGFNRSEVMNTLSHLSDTIGPRLTGSPALLEANEWTRDKLTEWGLANARLEGFEFGRGWSANRVEVFMTSPRTTQLYAQPVAWLPGTAGLVEGEAIYAPMKTKDDFGAFKGKLKGKVVFISEMPEQQEPNNRRFIRYDENELEAKNQYTIPLKDQAKDFEEMFFKIITFEKALDQFLKDEGALALVRRPWRNAMLHGATGYQYRPEYPATIPGISLVAEHYDRAVRLMNKKQTVSLSLNVDVTFHEEDTKSYNTIAEIPGQGRNPEIVMAGGHLDSWFAGDGAVDNGTGIAVVMEAVRILKAIGVKPKRTIRVGLWGGEEQGLFGSLQHVNNYYVTRPDNTDENRKYAAPMFGQFFGGYPLKPKKDFERFSMYVGFDNGSGKIRGIYAEENAAAAAIFKEWLVPFHDLGATTVSMNKTQATDHVAFSQVGLPGFQFIQDPLDYGARLHHTQMDVLSHAYEKDLKQASVIIASFLYNAAMRDERMPRKPLPTGPADFSKDYDKTDKEDDQ
ncbi:M20/M25/M40 family metallo-hydrolase [Paremcibacter congregatus]|uniref:M20/M25/M40 family metallo-hydrolase n=1 Tax=Paremcibacter congregatus TaxID=2043170 RepID=UPI003A8E32D4